MSCPTCSHTMDGIGYGMFHCPRCGTLINCPTDGAVHVPALVIRCRRFGETIGGVCAEHAFRWKQLGVSESIDPPGQRHGEASQHDPLRRHGDRLTTGGNSEGI